MCNNTSNWETYLSLETRLWKCFEGRVLVKMFASWTWEAIDQQDRTLKRGNPEDITIDLDLLQSFVKYEQFEWHLGCHNWLEWHRQWAPLNLIATEVTKGFHMLCQLGHDIYILDTLIGFNNLSLVLLGIKEELGKDNT